MSEAEDSRVEVAASAAPFTGEDNFRRDLTVPLIIGSAMMMQTLNATVIVNALPAMAISFGEAPLRLNLAITLYLLAAAVFMPLSGWVADKFGARRIFLIAIVLYAVSSAACGFAQNLPQLLISRVIQGAAGAMLLPVGRLVLLRTTPKSELVGALSVVTIPSLLGPVIGPLVGGAIVTFADWRWIFFINLPIAVLGVFLVRASVPDVKEQEVSPIDVLGLVLTGFGLAGIVFGFENLGRSDLPPAAVAGLFLGGAACLWAYARYAKVHPHAVLDLSIFRIPTFQASVVGGSFMRIAVGANPFLLAMLLQVAFGLSAFAAGAMTFISAAGALLMKTCAPPILRRFGFRQVLIFNGLIVAVSFMAYAIFRPTTPHWLIMIVLAVSGFFRSLQFTSLNGLAYADIDEARMSRAATTAAMAQQIVQSLGVGVAAMLIHISMTARHETVVTPAAIAPAFILIGLVSLASLWWFVRLPADAGAELNARRRPRRRAPPPPSTDRA